jgi:hypothetical protein
LVALVLAMATTEATAADHLLVGSKLAIKAKDGRGKFVWLSKGTGVTMPAQLGSATLIVKASRGEVAGVALTGWYSNRSGSAIKYVNKLAPSGDSPCSVGSLNNGKKIKVVCKQELLAVSDPNPTGTVDIRLSFGGDNYCASFGGVKVDEPGRFFAKDSPAPAACTTATLPPKRVFVTSTKHNGSFGGLTGADGFCQTHANAAVLGGTWKAWLSTENISARDRLTHHAGAYVRLDNAQIAASWSDLVDGSLMNSISVSEFGTAVPLSEAWTSTLEDGTSYFDPYEERHCLDWGSADVNFEGSTGRVTAADTWWTNSYVYGCQYNHRLYCFEQ